MIDPPTALASPSRALGLAGLLAGSLLFTVRTGAAERGGCPLEQEWQVGDAYAWQWIDFARGGRGVWTEGDRHGEVGKAAFRWRREGTRLIITARGERRAVGFQIERHRGGCTLRFDGPPLEGASREFHGAP